MKSILMMALLAMLTASLPVKAEQSGVERNIGVYSQYIWRGSQESANAVISGEVEAELGAGFVASVEFISPTGNTPQGGNITEIDTGLTYTLLVGEGELMLGYLHSAFINHAAGNTGEVVLAVDYAPVSITYYNAVLGNADGWKNLNVSDVVIMPSARLAIPTYTGKPSNANQFVFASAIGF